MLLPIQWGVDYRSSAPYNLMKIETPYPKKRILNSDTKLTILIILWVLDKIAMIILFGIFN